MIKPIIVQNNNNIQEKPDEVPISIWETITETIPPEQLLHLASIIGPNLITEVQDVRTEYETLLEIRSDYRRDTEQNQHSVVFNEVDKSIVDWIFVDEFLQVNRPQSRADSLTSEKSLNSEFGNVMEKWKTNLSSQEWRKITQVLRKALKEEKGFLLKKIDAIYNLLDKERELRNKTENMDLQEIPSVKTLNEFSIKLEETVEKVERTKELNNIVEKTENKRNFKDSVCKEHLYQKSPQLSNELNPKKIIIQKEENLNEMFEEFLKLEEKTNFKIKLPTAKEKNASSLAEAKRNFKQKAPLKKGIDLKSEVMHKNKTSNSSTRAEIVSIKELQKKNKNVYGQADSKFHNLSSCLPQPPNSKLFSTHVVQSNSQKFRMRRIVKKEIDLTLEDMCLFENEEEKVHFPTNSHSSTVTVLSPLKLPFPPKKSERIKF
ncbi:hypothetical protein HDU92_007205 [Lobulomyces angularis]|nr:hypothetical protein HDU92_007205 [Lobulomyces angularis]